MPRKRLAKTPEERERELVRLATDLAEEQMREGKASSAVICHFLKLATEREKLERAKLERENRLLAVKAEAINSTARIEELYDKAISAMRSYSSPGVGDENL